jgi:ABC-type transporter Mla subunit MlaD
MIGPPSSDDAFSRDDELQELRARVTSLERERSEAIARANAAVAAAQDKSYWLDRWNVDLNGLMRRRGASEARAALRALRAVYRLLYKGRRALREGVAESGDRLRRARGTVAQEREAAERLAATQRTTPAGDD